MKKTISIGLSYDTLDRIKKFKDLYRPDASYSVVVEDLIRQSLTSNLVFVDEE